MKQAHRIGLASAALFVIGPTALAAQPGPQDPRLPYRNGLPDADERNVRVVDGRSGRPIRGAMVYTIAEREHPARGQYWSDNQCRTDRSGLARIRRPMGDWTVVEAPGYAVAAWSGNAPGRDGVLTMYPGLDVPVQLRNYLGELQPGAGLGFCVGCGHSPDVRFAVSGEDGIAWLRGISRARGDDDAVGIGDLYPLGSGLDGDYDGLPRWFVGSPPVQRYCAGAPDVVGRLIEADGDPAADVIVRQFERHRGPVTKTDKNGEYRLVSPFNGKRWVVIQRGGEPEGNPTLPPTEKVTIRLPPRFREEPPKPAKPIPFEVRVLHAGTQQPIPNLWLTARSRIGDEDASAYDETDEAGLVTLELPPGETVLWTKPESNKKNPEADQFAFERVIQVGEANKTMTLRLRPLRRVPLLVEQLPKDGIAVLATATGEDAIELESGRATLRVPDGPSAVHLLAYGQRHVVRVPDSAEDETWTIRWPQSPRYTLPVRDTRGQPVTAKIAFWDRPGRLSGVREDKDALRTSADGTVVVPPEFCFGTIFVLVLPDAGDLLPLIHRIDLPLLGATQPGLRTTLEPLTVPPRVQAPLRVVGEGVERWTAHLMRPGLYYESALGADGLWQGPVPKTGDWIVLDPPESTAGRVSVRVRQRLVGPGPWRLVLPERTLQLDFETPQGTPLAGVHVYLRDQHWVSAGATLQMDHLSAEPDQVTCGHPEHGAITIPVPTNKQRVSIRLPGR